MKKISKNNKGMLGVDLTISIVVLSIFVSIISVLIYNIALSINASKRNSVALTYVVDILEKSKTITYNDININNMENIIKTIPGLADIEDIESDTNEYKGKINGYTIYTTVEKYNELTENQGKGLEDRVKIITVNVEYKIGNNVQNVNISTLRTL